MENHTSLGSQNAACDEYNTRNINFTELDLTELDHIARQVEWDILHGIGTTITHIREDNANQQYINSENLMGPAVSPYSHEYNTQDEIIEQPPIGSPDTSTTGSIFETPPMPNYELRLDWAATWDTSALEMIPDLPNLSLGTGLDWPMIDNSWLNVELGSAAALEILQPQFPKTPTFSLEAEPDAWVASISRCHPAETVSENFSCSLCPFIATSTTKLKTHINKHTRPFRCTAPSCDYATAEKKSLKRHVLAKAKWDDGHRLAAEGLGVKEVKYLCTGAGCGYSTIREDNLRRHVIKCPAMGRVSERA